MAGRPRIYESGDELQEAIDNYFSQPSCDLTITGLALHLGFCDRQSLYDYEKSEIFSCIIKTARMRVENAYERKLNSNACTGAIFALKNMGWRDKTEQELTGSLGVMWNEVKTYDTK